MKRRRRARRPPHSPLSPRERGFFRDQEHPAFANRAHDALVPRVSRDWKPGLLPTGRTPFPTTGGASVRLSSSTRHDSPGVKLRHYRGERRTIQTFMAVLATPPHERAPGRNAAIFGGTGTLPEGTFTAKVAVIGRTTGRSHGDGWSFGIEGPDRGPDDPFVTTSEEPCGGTAIPAGAETCPRNPFARALWWSKSRRNPPAARPLRALAGIAGGGTAIPANALRSRTMVEFWCDFDPQGVESRGFQGPVPALAGMAAGGTLLWNRSLP